MSTNTRIALAIAAAVGFLSTAVSYAAVPASNASQVLARKGADNKPGDVKGEGKGHPVKEELENIARRGRGADNKPGDVKGEGAGHPVKEELENVARRGRGADNKPGDVKGEGAGHPATEEVEILARRGADDPAGHQRREDRRADRRRA